MYSGTIKQNGDRQYSQQCHTHTKAQSSLCHRQPSPPCVPTGHSQPHARLHPVLSTGLQTFKAPEGNFRVFFFFLSWLLRTLHGHRWQVRVSSQTLWAALTFRGVLRGCRQWQTCHQGPQSLNVVGLGALDPSVLCRELSSDLSALYHAGQQTGFSCLFLK